MTTQPYRVPAERPDHYAEAWARLRRRRLVRRLSFGVAVYAFATLLVFTLKSAQFVSAATDTHWLVMASGMALGVVFLAAAFALARFRLSALRSAIFPRVHDRDRVHQKLRPLRARSRKPDARDERR